MPPRKRPPPSNPPPPTNPTPRRSKLAKEHSVSSSEESQILSAFSLFSTKPSSTTTKSSSSKHPPEVLATADLRRALIALDAPPASAAELTELIETVDPEGSGSVSYEHFLAIAALKINQLRGSHGDGDDNDDGGGGGGRREEVEKAFGLFTAGRGGEITLRDLQRVARELKEDVPDAVLRDMVREAKGGELGGVGIEEFEGVMRRAGVFS